MSNRFEFDGVIGAVEKRESKSGKPYWIIDVSGDDATVPFTLFTPPPAAGLAVRVTGKLGAYNGYAKLEQAKIDVAGGGLKTAAPVPVGDDNAGDDSLPF